MNVAADILIRSETPADEAAIRDVTRRAFAGLPYADGTEQDIIDALRHRNALSVSLVADRGGTILGHVAFSPASPEDGAAGWYTLGPVSVAPEVQRQGIGHALITSGLARLRDNGASGCIVVGDTSYYSRFGFVKAPRLAPPGVEDHFMVLSLGAPAPHCVINFHDAFLDPGQK
jgi:putative acetyltransferase